MVLQCISVEQTSHITRARSGCFGVCQRAEWRINCSGEKMIHESFGIIGAFVFFLLRPHTFALFLYRFLLSAVVVCQAVSTEAGKSWIFNSVCGRLFHSFFLTWITRLISGCEGSECGKAAGVSGKPKQQAEFLNKFNEMNTQTPQRQHRNPEAALPFIGLTGGELIIIIMEEMNACMDW